MLGSLTGTITGRLGAKVLIEVNNIGYWVATGSWQPEGVVTAYLYHHVREEASDLYGFPTLENLGLFEKLLTVSGIGPKAALAVLSLGAPDQIAAAIQSKNTTFLALAPGIGKKAAEKIVVELSGSLLWSGGNASVLPSHTEELRDALRSLGYNDGEISKVLTAPRLSEEAPLETRLRIALAELQGR